MAKALEGRLNALARANNLIHLGLIGAKEGGREETTIDALLRAVLLPYMDEVQMQRRECITLTGPSVMVGGDAVTSLALVFHETEGFGSKLVNRSVTGPLQGQVEHDWRQEGLTVHIRMPLERLTK